MRSSSYGGFNKRKSRDKSKNIRKRKGALIIGGRNSSV
jgi:hypothetical protein